MGQEDKEFTVEPVGFVVPGVMQIDLPGRQVIFGGRSELEIPGSHQQRVKVTDLGTGQLW